jgi:hypothetical protein
MAHAAQRLVRLFAALCVKSVVHLLRLLQTKKEFDQGPGMGTKEESHSHR